MRTVSDINQQVIVLQQLSVELMAAWKNKDKDAFNRIVHDDFLLVNDTLKNYCINKKKWMKFLFEKFGLVTFNYDFQKIEFFCDDVMAVSISKLSILTAPNYTTAHRFYLNTDIWTNPERDGLWKLTMRKSVSLTFI